MRACTCSFDAPLERSERADNRLDNYLTGNTRLEFLRNSDPAPEMREH